MDIQNKTVLVLGGWGLVGSAIIRKIMEEKPRRIVVTSLTKSEAEEAVADLRKEFPKAPKNFFVPWWGNIFVRNEFKDLPRQEILGSDKNRLKMIEDIVDDLRDDGYHRSTIYHIIKKFKPDIVIDCINSATAIAYQDIFQSSREVVRTIGKARETGDANPLIEASERLLCTLYMPQLIRHIQLLYRALKEFETTIYLKIGTSGSGGMGFNIPYTHSEERPSQVLLGKTAVAGAHTLLLFIMGRTPEGAITKEIKPTAAIAWKKIGYGEIRKRGRAIKLVDCPPDRAVRLKGTLKLKGDEYGISLNDTLKNVYIDTGENGTFSLGEFEAISTPGQMEFVTPEEIADAVIYEIRGGNTGHDIINALDNSVLPPTYRAGYMFEQAMVRLSELERKHKTSSVAFEILGPPRLSKLLYEAHLLRLTMSSMNAVVKASPRKMSKAIEEVIRTDDNLRSAIISIGLPILMPDGKQILRGNEIKIPPFRGDNELPATKENIEMWAKDGWVDLRPSNMEFWKERFRIIMDDVAAIPANDTSSRYLRNADYWEHFEKINPGKIVGWIFTEEEQGLRMKS
jgi:hypothetical protein